MISVVCITMIIPKGFANTVTLSVTILYTCMQIMDIESSVYDANKSHMLFYEINSNYRNHLLIEFLQITLIMQWV